MNLGGLVSPGFSWTGLCDPMVHENCWARQGVVIGFTFTTVQQLVGMVWSRC